MVQQIEKLHDAAKYAEGLTVAQQALTQATKSMSANDPRIGTLSRYLAEFHQELTHFREAETIYKQSLAILEKHPPGQALALALNSLAGLYQTTGRFSDAEPLYVRAVSIFEAGTGGRIADEHLPDLAEVLKDLAELYRAQGRFAKAEPLYRRALSMRKQLKDNEGLATVLNDFAGWHREQARYTEAEVLHKEARGLFEKEPSVGVEHPDYANATNDLAETYRAQGRLAEAEPLYVQALAVMAKSLGDDHPRVSLVRNNLGELHRAQGRYDKAETQYGLALANLKKKSLITHPDYATTLNNLACLRRAQGRLPDAEALYKEALKLREEVFGTEHLELAVTLTDLAGNYMLQSRYKDAEPLFVRAVDIYMKIVGPGHTFTKSALLNLATVSDRLGKSTDAATFRTRAAAIPGWDVADVSVFFATNRGRLAGDGQLNFGADQKISVEDIALGRATVRAPKSEVLNRAARDAGSLRDVKPVETRQTKEATLIVNKVDHFKADQASFLAEAKDRLARATRFPKQAIIYVHGYNNSFDDAVRRTAMIAYDLDFDGLTATFAWPARSGVTAYLGDRDRAATAAPFLLHMIELLGAAFPDVSVNLIGHSTGAEVIVNALERLADRSAAGARVKIGEVIFAHADVYTSRLAAVMPSLRKLPVRVTSYSSKEDWAMWASDTVRRDGARVGGAPIYLADVDAIDISGFGQRFSLNHNVFIQHPVVFGDMARLMATSRRPVGARTPDFVARKTTAGQHWEVKPRPR